MSASELSRETYEDIGRVYTDYDSFYPSVTTVLDVRPKPEALKRWKQNTPDWREIMEFKADRGTLIHYHLLNEFEDGDLWSEDEQSSQENLKRDLEDWQRYKQDRHWAEQTWDIIKRVQGINEESVLDVEVFVVNDEVGYAGQFDLMYRDEDYNLVLADLKTSLRVYDKHQLQLAAYEHAVDISVDRLEVIRLHPDTKTWEISSSDEWLEDRADLWDEFTDLREELQDEHMQELKDRILADR